MKKFSTVLFVLVLLLNSSFINAQSACCGLDFLGGMLLESGVSGGYGFQQYSPKGLNDFIENYNLIRPDLSKSMDKFAFAHGWKVGANLIQFQDGRMLYGLNVFYQQLKEKHYSLGVNNVGRRDFDLSLISYGVGFSFSYVINKNFDFKIADIKMSWNKAKFKNTLNDGASTPTEEILENAEASIGAQVSTSLLFYPFPPYISLELNGGYSFFTIDDIIYSEGNSDTLTPEPFNNFIDGGGFFGFAQLNIAIPIFQ